MQALGRTTEWNINRDTADSHFLRNDYWLALGIANGSYHRRMKTSHVNIRFGLTSVALPPDSLHAEAGAHPISRGHVSRHEPRQSPPGNLPRGFHTLTGSIC